MRYKKDTTTCWAKESRDQLAANHALLCRFCKGTTVSATYPHLLTSVGVPRDENMEPIYGCMPIGIEDTARYRTEGKLTEWYHDKESIAIMIYSHNVPRKAFEDRDFIRQKYERDLDIFKTHF
mmetsp:Transcript_30981/g.72985  ORF Transcript_30981/g.72985 Transcript_30981/m.72985 type:complete len:123 (+) Transcript_30981:2050-2418(+)